MVRENKDHQRQLVDGSTRPTRMMMRREKKDHQRQLVEFDPTYQDDNATREQRPPTAVGGWFDPAY